MSAVLQWLGVILLAWVAACLALTALYVLVRRPQRREAARQQARDDAAADAVAQFTARVDDEYRALCEREGGRG
jgi:hypothetical protein